MSGTTSIGNLSVVITASDKTAAGINAARKNLDAVGGSASKVADVFNRGAMGAIRGAGTAVQTVTGHVSSLAGTLVRSAAPIAGLGVVGGATALATHFVDTARQLRSGSRALQMSVPELHAFQLGASQVGVGAEDATSAMRAFGDTIYDAVGGRNPAALATTFGALSMNLRDVNGRAITGAEGLGALADNIQRLNNDPRSQQQYAQMWGVEALLPVLRNGRAGLEDLMRFGRANTSITAEQVEQAAKLRMQWNQVTTTADRLSLTVGAAMAPALTAAMNSTEGWVRANERWIGTAIQRRVEEAASGTGNFITAVDAAVQATLGWEHAVTLLEIAIGLRLMKAITGVNAMALLWKAPAWLARLLGMGALTAATLPLALRGDQGPNSASPGAISADEARRRTDEINQQRQSGGFWSDVGRYFGFGGPGGGPANAPNGVPQTGPRFGTPAGGASNVAPIADQTLSPEARGFLNTIAGPESGGRYDIRYGGYRDGRFMPPVPITDLSRHPNILEPTNDGRMSGAAGRYQFVNGTWQAGDRLAGGNGNFSPAAQDRAAFALAADQYRRQTGRDLNGDLRDPNRTNDIGRVMSGSNLWTTFQANRLQANIAAERARAGQAAPPVPAAPPQVPTTPPVAAPTSAAPASPLAAAPPSAAEGKVAVDVRFANAPRGMIANTRSEGSVSSDPPRVETAMQDLGP